MNPDQSLDHSGFNDALDECSSTECLEVLPENADNSLRLQKIPGQYSQELCSQEQELFDQRLRDRQLRVFFESALDAMVVADDEGVYVDANPAACDLFGLPREELLGRRIVDFAESGFDFDAVWQAFQQDERVKVEFRLVRPDREVRDVEYVATANFVPHRHLFILRDITERKQAEVALKLSEARYRAIVEDQTDLICRLLPDGTLTFVNRAYCRYFHKSPEELVGYNFMLLIPEDEQPLVQQHFFSISRENPVVTYEHKVISPSGEMRWQQRVDRAIFTSSGELVEIQSVGRDMTSQKTAQLALQELNHELEVRIEQQTAELKHVLNYLSFHVENSPLAFIGCNEELRIQFWSKRAEQIFGWKAEEVLGRCWKELDLVHEEDFAAVLKVLARLRRGESQVIHTNRNYRKDRSVVYCEWYNSAQLDEKGNLVSVLSLVHDVSDRKRAEDERNQAEEALRQREVVLREAQRVAHVGSWELDLHTQKITWSDEMFHIFGLDPSQAEPTYPEFLQMLHPDDSESLQRLVERAVYEGIPYEIEHRIVRPDGSIRYLIGRGEPTFNSRGKIIKLFGAGIDITERKLIEEQLRSQAEREQLLRNLTQRIHQSLNLDQILTTTVNEVRQVLQADRVLVFRFRPDWSGVVAVESVIEPWINVLGTTIKDPCFVETLITPYKRGRIQVTEDIFTANLIPCHVDFLAGFQVRANLVVPILQRVEEPCAERSLPANPNLWGLLIAHQCSGPRHWQTSDIDLMKQLAAQAGIAIQQAELHHQLKRFNAELERQVRARTAQLQLAAEFEATLKRITDRVRDSLDESQILQNAVEELAKGLGVNCCNAALFDLNQGTSTICYEYTNGAVSPSQGRVSRITDFPEIYDQLLKGQYFQFCSLLPNPVRGRVAMLCCPIFDNYGVLGDLWLINQSYYGFSEQDIRLVQQVANQCAIALRQSRLYQTAQTQVQELERLNQLKDDFLSTVSHELRTPMSNIKMATQMLETVLFHTESGEKTTSPSLQKLNRYFQILRDECQREISLINDLLDLARLDAGTEVLIPTSINLSDWLPGVVAPFIERTRNQQQQLVFDVSADLPPLITEQSYLERILTELLNNACKYTPAGETITIAATTIKESPPLSCDSSPLTPPSPSLFLQISVTNSGVEIPLHELSRVFDKFYRIPKNDPWKHGGTGLGLALVKKLVERLGGTVQVESLDHKTCFKLQFSIE
ncbi:MAG: PAS domain S-box protein [Leptolyngbyaceae cyanobacterium HOT.MB2.61]|nr:PAS domain S-box protein [Leptolyngbyaceae cyanobacterium HOT.MB2.61]